MSETVLHANTGRPLGSPASRRLRREEIIPGVLYGMGMDPITVSVARRDLRLALSGGAGANTVLDLTVDGTVYPAIVKDMQRHPVRRNVTHVDFIQISLSAEITVSVPFHLTGEAKEVMQENGLVDQTVNEIEVTTTPRSIPDEIVFDVSELTMDSVIHLSDLEMPAGVRPTGDPGMAVITVLVMRTPLLDAEDEAAEEAAAEAEEGEEGDGGEAATDGDASE